MNQDPVRKVVLAYSGGLDTSVIVAWLREHYDCQVVCFTADVGQGEELADLDARARASGASKLVRRDLREEFARDYLFPLLRSGAIYERRYLLGTSIARPLIARHQVEVAEQEGADAVAHGCTGKGNDQVRFESAYAALSPHLRVIAPWREWDIRSREDALAYLDAHGLPHPPTSGPALYSRDGNLWHLSHEGGPLEDAGRAPDADVFQLTAAPEQAPDAPEALRVDFVSGTPVALNGQALSPAALVAALNQLGGRHAIGRVDLVENRLVGMKSRGIYETPGGTILYAAHAELESLTLDRDTLHAKDGLAARYAELVYDGLWFTPLREALDAFFERTQQTVTGTVHLKLYKGNVIITGRESPYSLYREDIATFGASAHYDHADAAGFIRLHSLPQRVRALSAERGWPVPVPVPAAVRD
jgi:argininosuccinate synthase